MKGDCRNKVDIAEDYCFICKDGGLLLVCDYKCCLKAYHPECVGKDSTFLETGNRWTCSWHSCLICHKSSKLQCFCCPNSVCRACTRAAAVVHVKRKKGFCTNCLRLALLIEENLDVDSDGGKVDFNDTETYEFLFKEYWDLIKQHEGLSVQDLHAADALLKKGENYEELSEDERDLIFDVGKMDQKSDDEFPLIGKFAEQDVWTKTGRKKYTSRRKEFSGWGSAKLIDFLRSIGRNVDKPFSQDEVYDIIHSYIHENKLRHPQKKKKVICDENLRLLFGRKSFSRLRISGLLESHFAENQKSDNGSPDVSEDEDATVACNRPQRSRSEVKTHISGLNELKEKVSEAHKNCFASITANNIKLVYLRRSLVEEFLKNLETFENKVMDCFVRVKSDPNGFYLPKTYFQLVQITGIKRASESYKTGEISTDIVLKVSNLMKDIRICMVSDDDFSEEECEDLRYRMKEGHLKRPTVGELDEKAKIIHEDLTNHWIDREIVMLQNRIDRANEKGWRRELFEYIERKELLQTPSERLRLLKEPPKVAAEEETEREDPPNSPTDAERVNEGNEASANDMGQEVSANLMVEERENEGNGPVSHYNVDLAGNGAVSLHNVNVMLDLAGNGAVSHQNPRKRGRPKGNRAASKKRAAEIEGEGKTGTEDSISSIYSFFFGNGTASGKKVVERETEGKVAVSIVPRQLDFGYEDAIIEKAAEREDEGIGAASRSPTVSRQQDSEFLKKGSDFGNLNLSAKCSLRWWFDKVKSGLKKNETRLSLFKKSPFSFLLDIPSFRFIGALSHFLFLRHKGDLVFEIRGKLLKFTEMDFALITGLKTGDLSIPKIGTSKKSIREKYLNKKYPILKKHLGEVFDKIVDTNKHEDVVKVALLMCVELFIRGTDTKIICKSEYIDLVDSLEEFNRYPWGSLAFKTMSEGVEGAVKASHRTGNTYNVYGCIFPLQIWAIERVPALRDYVISYVSSQIPRFIQYRGWKGWRYNTIYNIFESEDTKVILTLEPTSQELETEAIRLIREKFEGIEAGYIERTVKGNGEDNDDDEEDGEDKDEEEEEDGEGEGEKKGKGYKLREELKKERKWLKEEREELKKERKWLKEEREWLKKEMEALKKGREGLKEEMEWLKKKREWLKEEREWMKKEREELKMEKEELKKEGVKGVRRGLP
ncbi:uncharacterized protein LOC131242759 isoform X3 [Magnolia sinica]|uniref:uncharacterized protein LOC131242759 isoform X3 n=1 Tax=Magnolia sinica TaxID=86752 RepID=UPI00265A9F39|nr:uncharacterized protein LOC131242759 isoform X3 [Magnolia sinica]